MRSIVRTFTLVVLVWGLGLTAADAATITYNSLANWQSAVPGASGPTTFEENPSTVFTFYDDGPATFDGVSYTVNAGFLYTVDPDYHTAYAALGTGDVLSAQQGASLLFASFAPTSGFGFDWHSGGGPFMNVLLSTGEMLSIPAVAGQTGFFGVTSTVLLTGFSIQVPGILNIDNFRVATTEAGPTAVPEPASLLLIAGPVAMGLRRRLRRKA